MKTRPPDASGGSVDGGLGMARIVNVEQMRAIESAAGRKGLSYDRMMDLAGEAVFHHAVRQCGEISGKRMAVLCGSGNNGGDGLVAAAHLAKSGAGVRVFLAAERKQGDPRRQAAVDAGCSVESAVTESERAVALQALEQADCIIDAVLGTGTRLPLRPPIADLLDGVRALIARMERKPFVLAVDCPSGVDCDTGDAGPQTVPADLTVTLGAAKAGLIVFPAAETVGRIVVADIGLPPDMDSLNVPGPVLADALSVREWLRARPRNSHKGTYGRAIVVGGSVNYSGAPALAALGACRVGAGLVTLAVPDSVRSVVVPLVPEATWIVLPEDFGVIAAGGAEVLETEIANAQALIVGPGFGREKPTASFLKDLLQQGAGKKAPIGFSAVEKAAGGRKPERPPMILDADALRILSETRDWPRMLPPGSVLTPHPGEMSALTGLSKEEIQKDRAGTAMRCAAEWNAVVVLKGAFTVVAAPDGRCAIEPFATPALAHAGTGDVLAGAIGGLIAQGTENWRAAALGAYLHGRAGELASEQVGASDSVLARDVARCLPKAIMELRGTD
jgi:hydroxyethylthiazole kinase-like uncharacterized protein yjeF